MKLALTLGALMALAAPILAPTLALANGCSHDKRVMSCADGMKLDISSGTCVPDVSA